jgi:hypothetical protein
MKKILIEAAAVGTSVPYGGREIRCAHTTAAEPGGMPRCFERRAKGASLEIWRMSRHERRAFTTSATMT